eukprot:351849-Chlamydomonas_euryale.AAC.4
MGAFPPSHGKAPIMCAQPATRHRLALCRVGCGGENDMRECGHARIRGPASMHPPLCGWLHTCAQPLRELVLCGAAELRAGRRDVAHCREVGLWRAARHICRQLAAAAVTLHAAARFAAHVLPQPVAAVGVVKVWRAACTACVTACVVA